MMPGRTRAIVSVALKYLSSRKLATAVSIASIGLCLLLVGSVSLVNFALKKAAVESTIRYPLIVGPEGASSVQLIFSTIFHIDKPTGTIPFAVYQEIVKDKRVVDAYPIAVADSLESYVIVGTNNEFLDDLNVGVSSGELDVRKIGNTVLGSEVAERTELRVGDTFRSSHGMIAAEGADAHDELEYTVTGILNSTGGPEDAAVYSSYEAVWLSHGEETDHNEQEHEHEHEGNDKYHLGQGMITAVLVRTSNPVYTAMLEREYTLKSGTQAVDTGRAIRRIISYVNKGERIIETFLVITLVIAMAMILVTLIMSLNDRRKELALLRSLGVGRMTIALIVMIEALVITVSGAILGIGGGHVAIWWGQAYIQRAIGASVEPWIWTSLEGFAVLAALVAGQLLALIAMIWIYRMNLVEEVARD
ncbi:MAG: FtsX-like permease family protein [Deltaproteobacteria bacterium]|nr:FtsX-like permease family protein [Deltaproteobacteria bacterium]